jgi:hypothetical protein
MKAIKKAQNGNKTKDSTDYFKGRSANFFAESYKPEYTGAEARILRKVSDDFDKDVIRQSKKGKPGYDKNGYPLKKKAKSGATIAKAKDGKWMQKVSASIKRRGTEGKCTPITKPGCTGRAKALAKTFKKIAKSNKKK